MFKDRTFFFVSGDVLRSLDGGVRRFVRDDPPAGLVDALADTYRANRTAIAPVLRQLFAFASPHVHDLALCLLGGALSVAWFELRKG